MIFYFFNPNLSISCAPIPTEAPINATVPRVNIPAPTSPGAMIGMRNTEATAINVLPPTIIASVFQLFFKKSFVLAFQSFFVEGSRLGSAVFSPLSVSLSFSFVVISIFFASFSASFVTSFVASFVASGCSFSFVSPLFSSSLSF